MANTSTYDSIYSVKKAQIAALNGSSGLNYDSVYDEELAILKLLQGGAGGGARIDDSNTSTGSVWSSSKTLSEITSRGISIEIVSILPATGDSKKIYLVPRVSSETGNVYDEYVWISSTSSYEKVGSTDIDLTPYAKISDVNSSLNSYAFIKYFTQDDYDAEGQHGQNVLYMIDNQLGKGVEKIYMGDNVWHLVNEYDFNSSINTKQDTLVSGTNIKTINGSSLLGSGNIDIDLTDLIDDDNTSTGTVWSSVKDSSVITEDEEILANAVYLLNQKTSSAATIDDTSTSSRSVWSSNKTNLELTNVKHALNTSINTKQEVLVSGTNIKTIDHHSLLGSENLTIGLDKETKSDANTASAIIAESSYDLSTNKVNSLSVRNILALTTAEYTAIVTKDASTLYVITDASLS